MTTYNWETLSLPAPQKHTRKLVNLSGTLPSLFSGAIQIIKRQTFWQVTCNWYLTPTMGRNDVLGLLTYIEKTEHLIQLPYWGHVQRGAFGGTALVAGSSQTGRTINLDAASLSITDWIKQGDWIRFGASQTQGYMAAFDANSNGSGLVSVVLNQDILGSPTNNEAVSTSSSSASVLTCRCMEVAEWADERVSDGVVTPISATFIQDVLTP